MSVSKANVVGKIKLCALACSEGGCAYTDECLCGDISCVAFPLLCERERYIALRPYTGNVSLEKVSGMRLRHFCGLHICVQVCNNVRGPT